MPVDWKVPMITRPGMMAAALAAALPVGVLLAPAASAAGPAAPPASGTDPYLAPSGNGGYDAINYDVDLTYNAGNHGIADAKVVLTARASQRLRSFSLDAREGLRVRSVVVNGRKASYHHRSRKLVVDGFGGVAAGARFSVTTRYHGDPKPVADLSGRGKYGWLATDGGSVTFTEPAGTSAWLPSNDVFYDKATWRMRLTAPKGRLGVSTGKLLGINTRKGRTVSRWVMRTPIQPYTQAVVFDRFDYSTKPIAGIPAFTAVARRANVTVEDMRERTETAIKWLVPRLGKYPFPSTGAIVVSGADSAMETAGRPTYSPDPWNVSQATVLHEQVHQWFGNRLTARNARDIWLHEGFATYLENVATAQRRGSSLDDLVHSQYVYDGWGNRFHGQFGKVPLNEPTRRYLLNTTPYYRGQAALHALRAQLGDTMFWKVLRHLADVPAGQTSSTNAVINRAEEFSGRDLSGWATKWISSVQPQRLPVAPSHRQVLRELGPEILNAAGDFVWNPSRNVLAAMRRAQRNWSPLNQLDVVRVATAKSGKRTRYFVEFQAKVGALYPKPYRSCFVFERNNDAVLAGALLGVRLSTHYEQNRFTPKACRVNWP